MTARIVQRASLHEILAFLKGRGVSLNDEAIKMLKKKIEDEPIGKPTLERGRIMVKNPFFQDILDRTFTKRSDDKQKIAEQNPLLKLIGEKRNTLKEDSDPERDIMPEWLRVVFYEDLKWQPYMPFLGIPNEGLVIKISEVNRQDTPYIGFLKNEDSATIVFTTRRRIDLDKLPEAKFFRLRDGVFQYEIDEIKKLNDGYLNYIMNFNPQ